jgi:hypothetical protein
LPAAEPSTKKTPRLYAVLVPAPITKELEFRSVVLALPEPRAIRLPAMVVELAAEPM